MTYGVVVHHCFPAFHESQIVQSKMTPPLNRAKVNVWDNAFQTRTEFAVCRVYVQDELKPVKRLVGDIPASAHCTRAAMRGYL